jgi:hypothetical protein
MMKKLIILAIVVALIVIFALPSALFAAPGGMPAAHNATGQQFGGLIAYKAVCDPFWIVNM